MKTPAFFAVLVGTHKDSSYPQRGLRIPKQRIL
jgi:hypothetical protein